MNVIALCNPKGGSGKSTVAVHLARDLQLLGHSVLLIDADPQQSVTTWAEEAEDGYPSVIGLFQPKQLEREAPTLGASYDFVVIDTQGSQEQMVPAAINIADLVLMPIQASPYDLWAVSDVVDLIRGRQTVTDGVPASAFVLDRIKLNTRLSTEVREAVSEYGMPILDGAIHDRTAYAEALSQGATAIDRSGPPRQEVRRITRQIVEAFSDES